MTRDPKPHRRRVARPERVTPGPDRWREVLRYVVEHVRTEGYPPSGREVCARFGWRSTRTAAVRLAESWRVSKSKRRARGAARVARGIRVLDPFA